MQCLYCQRPLAPLRAISDGTYCSDEHGLQHAAGDHFLDRLFSFPHTDAAAGFEPLVQPSPSAKPFPIRNGPDSIRLQWVPSDRGLAMADEVVVDLLPESRDCNGALFSPEPARLSALPHRPVAALSTHTPVLESSRVWGLFRRHRSGYSCFAARYWKVGASLVPVLIAAAFYYSPSNSSKQAGPLSVFAKADHYLRGNVGRRAAVVLIEDFRTGLGAWESRSDAATAWAYDSNGFVRPDALAVYRPTTNLTDYKLQFTAQLDQPLGTAFRIEDWNHYYALKLVVVQSGALTAISAVRYSVVNGKEIDRVIRQIPSPVPNTSLYRIGIDVHGSDFTLISQGHVVDYWSDGRYVNGGIGFFGSKSGRARVRWVEVSHQYDWVGRLCALLTPNDVQTREIRN